MELNRDGQIKLVILIVWDMLSGWKSQSRRNIVDIIFINNNNWIKASHKYYNLLYLIKLL